MDKIEPPFETSTADALNLAQVGVGKGMMIHPFTCANRSDGKHGEEGGDLGVLIATANGWVCPHCDYTQNWAHRIMASTQPSGHPDWLQASINEQLPAAVARRIADYQELDKAKPNTPGVAEMLSALNARNQELNLRA